MNESKKLLFLSLRLTIAQIESLTARGNNDLAMLGQWSCDYGSAMSDMNNAAIHLLQAIREEKGQK